VDERKKIKKVLIYEHYSSPSYLNKLKSSGVEVWHFNTHFDEIIEYISSKNEVKDENPLMRMLHYLKANNKIITEND
jgi:Asp-tRNA(Asn)/Glu-tRNA(Gln) amidotransferase C subunit